METQNEPPRLVLASISPRRRNLLADAGLAFEVRPVDVVELSPEDHQDPWWAVRENARRKAEAARQQTRNPEDELIVAADTILVFRERWIGKPCDAGEALRILEELAGQIHRVATAVAIAPPRSTAPAPGSNPGRPAVELWVEVTEVTLKPLVADQIRAYHQAVDPLDKAGGYDIDQHGPLPGGVVASIRGSYSNVMGLPMERLLPRLRVWLSNHLR